ncbi:MAG: phenylacetate-CoA oxygenase subunit PaaJ [Rhodospirillales bacterium]|nr:phenylacetate-CoA oxygenase subunit PaaJ [Rhodospirillales bacterium]
MVTTLERAREIAASIPDPELPALSIGELGIVRNVTATTRGVEVAITPTYNGCPAMGVIALAIEAALLEAGFESVHIRLVREPGWTSDWIGAEAREKLRAAGIAPPAPRAASPSAPTRIACPRCASTSTEELAPFGATACKSLWRCLTCREPFEHFKCH